MDCGHMAVKLRFELVESSLVGVLVRVATSPAERWSLGDGQRFGLARSDRQSPNRPANNSETERLSRA